MVFAFNNREMLILLNKRYKYLCAAKFDKAEKIEAKLTEIKNEKFNDLVIPITFYCTFMQGVGQQAALKIDYMKCDTGHKV